MIQCYICHSEVETGDVQHRMRKAGSSGAKGFANSYRNVPVCPRCAGRHDVWQRVRPSVWLLVVAAGLVIGLILVLRHTLSS